MDDLLPRHARRSLEEALRTSRVVNLIGPRQAGKTTLVRDLLAAGHFVTLDDDTVRAALRADPLGQIEALAARAGDGPVIIDEAQRAPEIAGAIKRVVDRDRRRGQFLLTGSSNVFSTAEVVDTLAGRVLTLTLLPLSAAEVHRAPPPGLLDWAAAGADPARLPPIPRVTRAEVLDLVVRGGYPEMRTLPAGRGRTAVFRGYVDSIVERDVADLLAVRKTDALRRLVGGLAARSGGELNVEDLTVAVGVKRATVETWLDALERLSLVRRLGSWASGEAKREVRHPKLHLVDTGLLCALRNLTADSFGPEAEPALLGGVLETFVFGEIRKSLPHEEASWDLYHWRDRGGREVDIVAVSPPASLVAIEVKASTSVGEADFRHLRWFAAEGPGRSRNTVGVVLYLGNEVASFGPGLVALPISTLWCDPGMAAPSGI